MPPEASPWSAGDSRAVWKTGHRVGTYCAAATWWGLCHWPLAVSQRSREDSGVNDLRQL
jgi:hypothetical protein